MRGQEWHGQGIELRVLGWQSDVLTVPPLCRAYIPFNCDHIQYNVTIYSVKCDYSLFTLGNSIQSDFYNIQPNRDYIQSKAIFTLSYLIQSNYDYIHSFVTIFSLTVTRLPLI